MYKELDPLLHSQLRLAIISMLIGVEEAEFTSIREKTEATSGNLSIQLNKLKDAGYIEIVKSFKGNYPQTQCKITALGVKKFEEYINVLKVYLNPLKKE
jgi:DNA-binding transcriptional ArsR family regulator